MTRKTTQPLAVISAVQKNWKDKFNHFYASLKKRVFSGRGTDPAQLVKKAEKSLDTLKNEYEAVLNLDIKKLDKAYEIQDLDNLYAIAHELRGVAGTFNYVLLGIVADKLCRFIEAVQIEKENALKPEYYVAIEIYINTLKAVYEKGPQTSFGIIDKTLIDGLKKIHLKYFDVPQEFNGE